jgi:hypothetical protein
MSIETVNIILSLIDAGIGGIQRYRIVIVALIIFEIWEERQVPCAVFVLGEGLVPLEIILLRRGCLLFKVPWSSAVLFSATVNRNGDWICGIHFCSLESPRFIHIDPDAIVMELLKQILESAEPHLSRFFVEPVDKDRDLRPNLIDQVVVVLGAVVEAGLDKYVIRISHRIVSIASVFSRYSSINDRYNLLLISMKSGSEVA